MTEGQAFDEVVASGELRASLEALRDVLASSITEADPDKRAPLARQLRDVLKDLASMAEPEGSAVDDLAKRRAERRSSAVSDPPASGKHSGDRSRRARGERGTGT